MRRLLVAGLLSLVFVPAALVLHPGEAAACSCIPAPGPIEAAQGVDVVFAAKLVSVADAPKGGQYDIPGKIFTFDVTRTFKGQIDARVKVNTADNSAACGRAYEPIGSEWLIYARFDDAGQLHDNLCSRTRALGDADEDIREFEANPDALDDDPEHEPEPEPGDMGPEDPEPAPIEPPAQPVADPEPTAKPQRCAVIDDPSPAGGLAGLFALFGLAAVRRRR